MAKKKGRGWWGDSAGHSRAARSKGKKGSKKPSRSAQLRALRKSQWNKEKRTHVKSVYKHERARGLNKKMAALSAKKSLKHHMSKGRFSGM